MVREYKICGILSNNFNELEKKLNDKYYKDMFIKLLEKNILNLYYNYNVKTFIIDCEIGGNMMCGEIIIQLKSKLEIYLYNILPFKYREKNLKNPYKEIYKNLLDKSNITAYVNNQYTKKCFSRKDKLIVKYSDILFCIYSLKNISKIRNLLDINLIERKRLILLDIETLEVINFY